MRGYFERPEAATVSVDRDAVQREKRFAAVSISRSTRLAILACFLLAVALRFPSLSSKPLHHDESIHAFFSLPAQLQSYHYDPKYHGPFLYHTNALVYAIFGASDWSCRFLPALMGSALVLLAFPLACLRGGRIGVAFAFLAAGSPSLVYFSRFIRNDVYVAFFNTLVFLSVLSLARGGPNRWITLASLGLVFHFTAKETAYLFAATLAGYLPLLAFFPGLTGVPLPGGTLVGAAGALWTWAGKRRFALLAAAFLFCDVWILLYTSGLRHLADAPAFVRAISYWLNEHHTKRLGGPFFYYVPLLVFYEFLTLVPIGWLLSRRALAHPADRFCLYWSAASFLLYGWAGEKVPWLVIHTLLPIMLLSATGLARAWEWASAGSLPRRAVALGLGALLAAASIATTVRSSYVYPAPDPADLLQHSELLSFVQTTTEVPGIVREIVAAERASRLADKKGADGTAARIVVSGEATWPLAWYLRDESARWTAEDLPGVAAAIVLDRPASENLKGVLAEGYREIPFKLRGWWVPDWSKASPRDVLRYALTREPFGDAGFQDCVLWLKK